MADNRPRGREKNVTNEHGSVQKKGEGLGTGPVGSKDGYGGRPGTGSGGGRASSSSSSSLAGSLLSSLLKGKNGSKILIVIVVLIAAFFIIRACSGGIQTSGLVSSQVLSGFSSSSGNSTGWTRAENTGKLNTSVAEGARDRYTEILGDGKDKVTVMIYMCGTDLESKSKMGTADIREMCKATLNNENLNVILLTGGCKQWQTNGISSSTTQIWRVASGTIKQLVADNGNVAMTDPSTLSKYITWCAKNYPANRNMLIFWDHGGGSLSGYGYDEKFANSGSMTLAGINTALKNGGVKFDFIGFDACLMATAETAIMLSQYADYMIASEEVEPGVGWYYTDWLTALNKDTSMSTLQIGKNIIDSFTDYCSANLSSASTTLSLVDLAELETTIPDSLKNFAVSTSDLISNDKYTTVSDARSSSREFSPSSKIDQVDLVDLAGRMGTSDGDSLVKAILSAVKYNRTSGSMTNAYGLSIYFPYRKASGVNSAVKEYDAIGLDDEYSSCIKQFAGYSAAGQVSTGGTSSPIGSLLGGLSGASSSGASSQSALSSLLSGIVGGSSSGISIEGLTSSGLGSLLSSVDIGKASTFISNNRLDASDFAFKTKGGKKYIGIADEKWKLVQDIELNVFADDGEGYIDLGLDNTFEVEDGMLLGEYDGTWLAINGQIVAYYHVSTVDDGTNYSITGRVPCLYNGERADLILVFTDKNPDGSVAGVSYSYANGETATAAKTSDLYSASYTADDDSASAPLAAGDKIQFIADYYSYEGKYKDSYEIGDELTVSGDLRISNIIIDGETSAVYRFTDIYGQHFWSDEMN